MEAAVEAEALEDPDDPLTEPVDTDEADVEAPVELDAARELEAPELEPALELEAVDAAAEPLEFDAVLDEVALDVDVVAMLAPVDVVCFPVDDAVLLDAVLVPPSLVGQPRQNTATASVAATILNCMWKDSPAQGRRIKACLRWAPLEKPFRRLADEPGPVGQGLDRRQALKHALLRKPRTCHSAIHGWPSLHWDCSPAGVLVGRSMGRLEARFDDAVWGGGRVAAWAQARGGQAPHGGVVGRFSVKSTCATGSAGSSTG